jgi:hypothetical protein
LRLAAGIRQGGDRVATASLQGSRSLLGDVLRSSATQKLLAVLVTAVGRNFLVLAGLAAMCAGAWTANPVAGWLVTGGSLLVLDFKLRG